MFSEERVYGEEDGVEPEPLSLGHDLHEWDDLSEVPEPHNTASDEDVEAEDVQGDGGNDEDDFASLPLPTNVRQHVNSRLGDSKKGMVEPEPFRPGCDEAAHQFVGNTGLEQRSGKYSFTYNGSEQEEAEKRASERIARKRESGRNRSTAADATTNTSTQHNTSTPGKEDSGHESDRADASDATTADASEEDEPEDTEYDVGFATRQAMFSSTLFAVETEGEEWGAPATIEAMLAAAFRALTTTDDADEGRRQRREDSFEEVEEDIGGHLDSAPVSHGGLHAPHTGTQAHIPAHTQTHTQTHTHVQTQAHTPMHPHATTQAPHNPGSGRKRRLEP